jgi:hypothetical protein
VSKIDTLGFGYAVPFVLAQEEIHSGQFWMMSRLWVLSASGSQAVNTHHYKMDKTQEHKNIRSLVDLGFLIRTSFDPAHPYAVRPSHIQRTYISFTPAGVRYYKSVVEKVNRYVRDDVLRLAESVTKERPNGNTLGP